MTRVAILWHMHQPFYEDLVTGEHLLPWVRLHALKDYYGMVALTREFPALRITFNLVPSLLMQLKAFAENRARDRDLDLSLTPADALTDADIEVMRDTFFYAQRQRMVDVYPRYAELLALRDAHVAWSRDDLRDLQVWHKLAWVDPYYLDADARVRALVAKDRGFSEDDKETLRTVELEILNKVVPEYAAAAARGPVELSTSPFYHPILPLLCDTDVYLRTHPDAQRPRRPFRHPEDATDQLNRAVNYHQALFGSLPAGIWPSEGSVSDAMVPLVAGAGLRWMATDELILARTLGVNFSRDGSGRVDQPERLYTPYRVRTGNASVTCLFRDHALSDLIGFTYSGWNAEAAAEDFCRRLVDGGRAYSQRGGRGEPVIPVILDGENAWEHFEGGGRPFLRALYHRLTTHPELRTVTMSEACAEPLEELPGIFPGSWIDANFSIWIGHADDQRAWSQLADARDALEFAGGSEAVAAAREEVLIAEGSDWFWWYGDDHSSANDAEFDDLFRRHLRNVYRLLNRPVPDELYVPNRTTDRVTVAQTDPTGLITPAIDGEDTSYFEWLGAGTFVVKPVAGSMHRADKAQPFVRQVQFGFDATHLYVRVDGHTPLRGALDGHEVNLVFVTPADRRISLRTPPAGVSVAEGSILEAAVPLSHLGIGAGETATFYVTVTRADVEEERHPPEQPLRATAPDAAFAARLWSA